MQDICHNKIYNKIQIIAPREQRKMNNFNVIISIFQTRTKFVYNTK